MFPDLPVPVWTEVTRPRICRFGKLWVLRCWSGDEQDTVLDWYGSEKSARYFMSKWFDQWGRGRLRLYIRNTRVVINRRRGAA